MRGKVLIKNHIDKQLKGIDLFDSQCQVRVERIKSSKSVIKNYFYLKAQNTHQRKKKKNWNSVIFKPVMDTYNVL